MCMKLNRKLNHNFHNSGIGSKFVKAIKIITVILGVIGTLNTAILGVYIASTYLIVSRFETDFYAIQTCCVLLVIAISVVLMMYGSYLQWKTRRQGYLVNALTGVTVAVAYAYFALVTPVLNWLGILGVALLVPAPLSGILGALAKNLKNNKQVLT